MSSSTLNTDVLVVGGGPAGSTLARRLAQAGREVTLIDRAHFPRHKSCGGGLSRQTLDALQLDVSPVTEAEVDRLMVDGAWSGRLGLPVDRQCQVVDRTRFDAFLLDKAAASGAQVLQGHRLTAIERSAEGFLVTTPQVRIHARRVCACDGAFSPTAKALGFPRNREVCTALEALADLDPTAPRGENDAIFDFTALPMGYSWIFPRKQAAAIGVCTTKPMRSSELNAHFRRFVTQSKTLHGLHIHSIKGGVIPVFRRPREHYAAAGAYLVGDAAGLVDMFSGEGIQYAVKSAVLAAEALLGDGEAQYDAEVRRQLLPELVLAAQWAHLVFSLPPKLFGAMMSTPVYRYYLRYFTDIFVGVGSYRSMRQEAKGVDLLLRLPWAQIRDGH